MKNYTTSFNRPPDFRVRYRWLGRDDQSISQRRFQHMRSYFSYADARNDEFGNFFMIHPEFENLDGTTIAEGELIPEIGRAGMWILVDNMRNYRHGRINVGVKGFIVSRPVRLAEVEVIEVISLLNT